MRTVHIKEAPKMDPSEAFMLCCSCASKCTQDEQDEANRLARLFYAEHFQNKRHIKMLALTVFSLLWDVAANLEEAP